MFKKIIAAVALIAVSTTLAFAQTSPGLTQGQKLTPAQWNALFASKQDVLNYTPLNQAGGVMGGRLVTAASGASTAGFNMQPSASAPGSPVDGDMWVTPSGVFVRVAGVTIGPLSAAGGTSFAGANPLSVAFPAGIVTYSLNYDSTLTLSGANLKVNLNNANTWTATQTFPANSIALSKLVNLAANRVVGSIAGGAASELTPTQLTTLVNPFTATLSGAVNAPTTATGKFLRDDNSWQTVAGTGTVTSAAYVAGTGMSISGTTPCTTTCTWTFNVDKATAANFFAATSNKVLTTDIIYQAEVAVTYGTTTTFDFDNFINASVTLTGNITTQTLSNAKAGKAGSIRFIQDGTGGRTTVWNSAFKWIGGTPPSLSTAASAIDVLNYNCISTTYCQASLAKDVK